LATCARFRPRRCRAAQRREPGFDGLPRPIERILLAAQLVGEVRAEEESVHFERELRRIEGLVDVALLLRDLNRFRDGFDPFVHHRCDGVTHDAGPSVELERCGGEEAAPGENIALDVIEPGVADGHQSRIATFFGESGTEHLVEKAFARLLHGGQLQFFLRAEMGKESALGQLQLVGEPADRQPFESFDRGQIDSAVENRLPCALAFHA